MLQFPRQLFAGSCSSAKRAAFAIAAALLLLAPALRSDAQIRQVGGALTSPAVTGGPWFMFKTLCNDGTTPVRVGGATYIVDNTQPQNIDAQVYFASQVVTLNPGDCITLQVPVPMNADGSMFCSWQGDIFTGEPITGSFVGTDHYIGRSLDGLFYVGADCICHNQAEISGQVWLDDCDGILENGEPFLGGVKVTLKDSSNNTIGTTTTDNFGKYVFTNLKAGSYTVIIDTSTLPAGLVPSFDVDGVASPSVSIVTVATNENRPNVNFGYCSNGRICGTLYCDDNPANGKQDAGEPGLPNVIVTLKDKNGNVIATTKTDGNGKYCFSALAGGSYTVVVPNPANGLAITGSSSASVTIPTSGSATQDFRYHGGKISGFAFCDDNCNGCYGWGDRPLQGVIIKLKDANGNVVDTAITDCYGYYEFSDCVASGCYFVVAPKCFNGRNIVTCDVVKVCIGVGECKSHVDFGYDCKKGKIGGRLYCDKNNDGNQDCGENGLQGVKVQLKDDCGNVIAEDTTDCNGDYCFDHLNGGNYTVCAPAKANGMCILSPTSKDVCLAPCGSEYRNFRYKCAVICGRAFCDKYHHGHNDCYEHGLCGITIILKDCNGYEICRTQTDCNGYYKFDDCLKGGTYKVCAQTNYCGKYIRTCSYYNVTVGDGGSDCDNHFGYGNCCSW